jgi:hypothetical protein
LADSAAAIMGEKKGVRYLFLTTRASAS